jgi:hypothetical protein
VRHAPGPQPSKCPWHLLRPSPVKLSPGGILRRTRRALRGRSDCRQLSSERPAGRGIPVFPAPGHTPGHAAVLVSSGRQQRRYAGDAMVHPAQFEHPDWACACGLSPWKRCAREISCWSGLRPIGVLSRAIAYRAGRARSKRGRHRFTGAGRAGRDGCLSQWLSVHNAARKALEWRS